MAREPGEGRTRATRLGGSEAMTFTSITPPGSLWVRSGAPSCYNQCRPLTFERKGYDNVQMQATAARRMVGAAGRLRTAFHDGLSRRSGHGLRSEEHTSELQSLMRISYAVFCLKKKTHKMSNQPYTTSSVE